MTRGHAESEVLLLLGGRTPVVPCRLAVDRRGLLFTPSGDVRPGARDSGPTLVRWSALIGFDADASALAPDGTLRQVLEIRTDEGNLRVLAPAGSVSGLLAEVRRRSARWDRSRRPGHPEPSRTAPPSRRASPPPAAALAVALGAPLATILSFASAAFAAAAGAAAAFAGAAAAAVGAAGAAATGAVGRLLAPAARRIAPMTLPVRERMARSIIWLAAAAAGRWLAALLAPARTGPTTPGAASRRPRRGVPALAIVTAACATLAALVLVGPIASGAPESAPPSTVPHTGRPDTSSMGRMALALRALTTKPLDLPAATSAPVAAPPSLANAAPLSPHEVFGFAPYWELAASAGYNVAGLTTLAYFSIGVNPDGSLNQSGDGWVGYQSQALVNLVTRAHAAGDRVVLTVNCFNQRALDQLTSSPTAPDTLSAALVSAIEAKNLDGVNLDFEGTGSADQVGLTNLVSRVSTALHQVNPHWQVTMDTYASSAGDPGGFYDIGALAPWVDGFFVMSYQLNLSATPSAGSPLTSVMFSDLTTAVQYAAAVTPSKVILGLPYFGYDWPTTDGTMAAQATGGAVPITYGQVVASGHPIYWDSVTNTAWTSYQVGSQWHESYFENPTSLYMVAEMAQKFHFAGVGAWALGMDGNDPAMLAALDGFAPAAKVVSTGPTATTTSPTAGPGTVPGPATSTTATTTPASTVTTGTAAILPNAGGGTASFHYSGVFRGQSVTLAPATAQTVPAGGPGQQLSDPLTGFQTDDPSYSCLASEPSLRVWPVAGSSTQDVVVADQTAGDCTSGSFVFTVPSGGSAPGSTTTSTT